MISTSCPSIIYASLAVYVQEETILAITSNQENTVSKLLLQLNQRHGSTLRLLEQFNTGWNGGAYALVNAEGEHTVLKVYTDSNIIQRLQRAHLITDLLASEGVPVPLTCWIDALADGRTCWLTSKLPGRASGELTETMLEQLLIFNRVQIGRAISQEQNWSSYAASIVFAGESGWAETVKAYSPLSHDLWLRLEAFTTGKNTYCDYASDIMHGDLCLYNFLIDAEHVTGIIDWDAAGCGDCVLDLLKLLFSASGDQKLLPFVYKRLREYICERVTFERLLVYSAYLALDRATWAIYHYSSEDISSELQHMQSWFDDILVWRKDCRVK